jgi:hypothetical protein
VRRPARRLRFRRGNCSATVPTEEANMMKILLWIVGIIFLIGLLVVFGVIDLIF